MVRAEIGSDPRARQERDAAGRDRPAAARVLRGVLAAQDANASSILTFDDGVAHEAARFAL
jgi:hypothetical protein